MGNGNDDVDQLSGRATRQLELNYMRGELGVGEVAVTGNNNNGKNYTEAYDKVDGPISDKFMEFYQKKHNLPVTELGNYSSDDLKKARQEVFDDYLKKSNDIPTLDELTAINNSLKLSGKMVADTDWSGSVKFKDGKEVKKYENNKYYHENPEDLKNLSLEEKRDMAMEWQKNKLKEDPSVGINENGTMGEKARKLLATEDNQYAEVYNKAHATSAPAVAKSSGAGHSSSGAGHSGAPVHKPKVAVGATLAADKIADLEKNLVNADQRINLNYEKDKAKLDKDIADSKVTHDGKIGSHVLADANNVLVAMGKKKVDHIDASNIDMVNATIDQYTTKQHEANAATFAEKNKKRQEEEKVAETKYYAEHPDEKAALDNKNKPARPDLAVANAPKLDGNHDLSKNLIKPKEVDLFTELKIDQNTNLDALQKSVKDLEKTFKGNKEIMGELKKINRSINGMENTEYYGSLDGGTVSRDDKQMQTANERIKELATNLKDKGLSEVADNVVHGNPTYANNNLTAGKSQKPGINTNG